MTGRRSVAELIELGLPLLDGCMPGARLTGSEVLDGSERTTVLRLTLTGGATGSIVLKAYGDGDGGHRREPAALGLLTSAGVPGVSRLLAESRPDRLVLMSDVGRGPSLADRLLADDPAAAETALHGWATALGRLHVATAASRAALVAALAGDAPDTMAEDLAVAVARLRTALPELGLELSAAAVRELDELVADLDVTAPGSPGALTPADTCPDNCVEAPTGLVLLDFEGAQFRHLAWDAAYLTVPWPSCWCSWDLPPAVTGRVLDTWRAEVVRAVPAVAQPEFDRALRLAGTGWAFISVGWFLPRALVHDDAMARPPHPGPQRRALVQHRMGLVAATATQPALQRLAAAIRDATERAWGHRELPLAPAFRP